MTISNYEHRRAGAAATPFPALKPGELAVNTYNLQIAVGDAAPATSGNPIPIIAVRNFASTAQYAAGDMVAQIGNIYSAKAAITPGPFTASQWNQITGGSGGIPEAPTDGGLYGRKNAGWSLVPGASLALPLMNGAAAAGTSASWAASDHVHPSDTSKIGEAPLGTTLYGRLNGAWSAVPAAPAASTVLPSMDGAPAIGASTQYALADHVHPSDTSRAALAGAAFAGAVTGITPSPGDNSTKFATTAFVTAATPAPSSTVPLVESGTGAAGSSANYARADHVHPAATPVLRSYLAGLTLSTAGSSTTFSVAAGVAANSTNADMLSLAAAISKTTAAWAAGSGNGALDTGTIANSTWYHVHLIKRTDTQVVDVLVSLSATAPTLPTSYTEFRRIGSMKTNASGQWTLFHQLGDEFLWDAPVNDVNTSTLGTTATLFTLASVPIGVQVNAMFRGYFLNAATATCLVSSPDESIQVVDTPAANRSMANPVAGSGLGATPPFRVRTNTSAQIRAVASAASSTLGITTYGWTDRRGRDS